jgi:uncharacterized protein (TIGR02922 family)
MKEQELSQVTIIYYLEHSLELLHLVSYFPKNQNGRVILSDAFRDGKAIIAICEGRIKIMNKIGDRILAMDKLA